ncbi:MAG: glycosyltransferase family 2 protein [Proteobacteria bacterium]|nr:MAG: glycosyltransferase family 2 protein [Pseudomonadota bacterium]
MSNSVKISAFIVCKDEEADIRRCLESLKWCDEIIVVDSGSQDRTIEIAREYTDKIFIREWPGFVEQKRFALAQCSGDWILNLDADEEVSLELCKEIQGILSGEKNDIDGYALSRVVFHLGRWWRKGGWYPEYRLRLCRRSKTAWGGRDPHEKAIVDGEVARLKGELHHFTYSSLGDQVRSLNSLSSSAAKAMYDAGNDFHLIDFLARPIARFIKFYLIKRGFLEGFAGLIVALLEAYYVLLKYGKLWELKHNGRS